MNNVLEEETNAFRNRFMSHVPANSPDISLPVLKGHLLAEELMSDYISAQVSHPEHLRLSDNHWGFANKIELASALASEQNHDVWVWTALKKLNALRNKLSHGLEPKNLEKTITAFQSSVAPHAPSRYQGSEITIYGYVLFAVSGLFVVIKSEGGGIKGVRNQRGQSN